MITTTSRYVGRVCTDCIVQRDNNVKRFGGQSDRVNINQPNRKFIVG